MKIYNRYIIFVTVSLLLTTVIMINIGNTSLDSYYLIYFVEALIITELFAYFNRNTRRSLNYVCILLLAGFLVSLAAKVLKILT